MEGLNTVVFSLGSNLGDRVDHLQRTINELEKRVGKMIDVSLIYETPPMGFTANIDFLNLCSRFSTALDSNELLSEIRNIEKTFGRQRSKNGYTSRPIDIDIIFFNHVILEEEQLTIPHPRFRDRLFVLKPLNDLDSDFVDPVTNLTIEQLLNNCIDKSPISVHEKQIFPHD